MTPEHVALCALVICLIGAPLMALTIAALGRDRLSTAFATVLGALWLPLVILAPTLLAQLA